MDVNTQEFINDMARFHDLKDKLFGDDKFVEHQDTPDFKEYNLLVAKYQRVVMSL